MKQNLLLLTQNGSDFVLLGGFSVSTATSEEEHMMNLLRDEKYPEGGEIKQKKRFQPVAYIKQLSMWGK